MELERGEETWVRVLTLNAHQGLRAGHRHGVLVQIRDALRMSQTELIFLQEIGSVAGREATVHQYEVLADSVWSQHAYGRNAVAAGGHHGNALLSKHPVITWRNVRCIGWPSRAARTALRSDQAGFPS